MLGESVKSLGLDKRHVVPYFGVKEAVMPFEKFPEVDPVLGPEMRSTGEVLGLADTFGLAYYKSQEAVGSPLPTKPGKLLVSLSEKPDSAVEAVKLFVELGFEIVGTEGTIRFLAERGVEGKVIAKIGEGRPDVLDAIKNREVKLIINTPSGRRDARADDCRIRQAAIKYSVPYLTTIAAASAAAEGIAAAMKGKGEVRSLQEYHATVK
jgi:carbamoyl-phosphate synthase large subunit